MRCVGGRLGDQVDEQNGGYMRAPYPSVPSAVSVMSLGPVPSERCRSDHEQTVCPDAHRLADAAYLNMHERTS